MVTKDIVSYFRGPGAKDRKAAFKAAMAGFQWQGDTAAQVMAALAKASPDLDVLFRAGERINSNTANAIWAKLDR